MRLDAFAGDAGADDLGEPVDVERLQAEQRLDLDAHRLGPRLGAEDARSQPQLAEVAEEQDLPGALARRDGDDGAAHELRAAVEPETTGEQPVAIGDVDDRARAGAGAAERTRADLRPQRQVGTRVADQRRPPAGAGGAVHPDDLVSRDRQHAPWITVPEVPLGRERKRGQVVQRDRRAGLDPRLAQALTVERMIEQARHQRTEPLALERGPFVRRHCLRPLVPHRGHGTSRVASRWIVSVQAPGEDDACRIEAFGLSIEVWKTKFPRSTPATWPSHASHNTGQLACFAEDDDRVSDRHGRLGPAAMVGTFELVAAHLAFHRTRVGTQPPLGDPLSNDLGDRPPDRPGDLVRGKTPRGWPGDDARSAACPQTTAGRGPSPRPGRPGASAGGSRSGPAGAPRPPAPHPQDAWSAAPPARRAGGS